MSHLPRRVGTSYKVQVKPLLSTIAGRRTPNQNTDLLAIKIESDPPSELSDTDDFPDIDSFKGKRDPETPPRTSTGPNHATSLFGCSDVEALSGEPGKQNRNLSPLKGSELSIVGNGSQAGNSKKSGDDFDRIEDSEQDVANVFAGRVAGDDYSTSVYLPPLSEASDISDISEHEMRPTRRSHTLKRKPPVTVADDAPPMSSSDDERSNQADIKSTDFYGASLKKPRTASNSKRSRDGNQTSPVGREPRTSPRDDKTQSQEGPKSSQSCSNSQKDIGSSQNSQASNQPKLKRQKVGSGLTAARMTNKSDTSTSGCREAKQNQKEGDASSRDSAKDSSAKRSAKKNITAEKDSQELNSSQQRSRDTVAALFPGYKDPNKSPNSTKPAPRRIYGKAGREKTPPARKEKKTGKRKQDVKEAPSSPERKKYQIPDLPFEEDVSPPGYDPKRVAGIPRLSESVSPSKPRQALPRHLSLLEETPQESQGRPVFQIPDALSDPYDGEGNWKDTPTTVKEKTDISNLFSLRSSSPLSDCDSLVEVVELPCMCPFCKKEVDTDLLANFREKHPNMSVQNMQKFCLLHKKKSAKETWRMRNYPKIKWGKLDSRIRKQYGFLRKILEGGRSFYGHRFEDSIQSGQNRTLLRSDKNLTPGYYGIRGLRQMSENLIHEFSSTLRKRALEDQLISARGYTAYLQAVLVPELAVQLIMEDMKVGVDEAREILTESSSIGELLHDEIADVVLEDSDEDTN
ncbi:RTC4-like domain-containing protein [Podospora australis]|uniref:Restriction of telomere capping protein 4 n=1 Tax=Podospora australis TaxID=1536484 RepID=A0AAN6X159_9PEZI|nr:RTC4-like domain-containing protein [Podospora australis]